MSRPRKPGGRLAWMAFYVDDFLSATTNLSRAALGSYVLLILAYWRNRGPLKDSDVILTATARCSRADWRRDREILETFFEIRDGQWHHPRIDHELQVAIGQSMAGSISGTAGNERRWKASRTDRERDTNATRTRHEREPDPIANGSLSHHPPSTSAIAPVEETAFPVGLDSAGFRAAWLDWLAYRRESKLGKWKPRTVSAKLAEMAGWGEAAAIESIRSSIANGWQGLFEPKVAAGATFAQIRPQPKVDPLLDARRKLRALVEAVAEGAEVAVDDDALCRAEMCATAAEVDEMTKEWIVANRSTIEASGVWR